MATSASTLTDCTQLDTTVLERVNYFPRQLLTADDMTADQDYFIAKLRRHNRYLHGWGIVCGMEVTVAPAANLPWQVQIGAGYALGPYGDEIYIPNPVLLDLAQCGPGASTDPCDPASLLQTSVAKTGATVYIAVRYEECYAQPVRVMPSGCGCNATSCEPSRISDSYEIDCLSVLPPSSQPGTPGPSLCDILSGDALAQCPPCPTDPWLVLAQVALPSGSGTQLAQSQVDNVTYRRLLFSTAAIQDQVRLCCCATDRAPARVTSVNPPAGAVFTNFSSIPSAVILTFSKHLQQATVNSNTIQVLRTIPGAPSVILQGTVTYDDGNQSAQFTPAEALTIPGVYQVTAVGSGPNQILDSDNLALDGNDDGQAGGNFISTFTVSVTSPTPTPTPSPSPTPSPIQATVEGPVPPPTIRPSNAEVVGNLTLTLSGGASGQKVQTDALVTIAPVSIAATAAVAPAVLTDAQGTAINGVKQGANQYLFSGVSYTADAKASYQISNIRVDTSNFPGTTVSALVSFTQSSATITGTLTAVPVAVVEKPQ